MSWSHLLLSTPPHPQSNGITHTCMHTHTHTACSHAHTHYVCTHNTHSIHVHRLRNQNWKQLTCIHWANTNILGHSMLLYSAFFLLKIMGDLVVNLAVYAFQGVSALSGVPSRLAQSLLKTPASLQGRQKSRHNAQNFCPAKVWKSIEFSPSWHFQQTLYPSFFISNCLYCNTCTLPERKLWQSEMVLLL